MHRGAACSVTTYPRPEITEANAQFTPPSRSATIGERGKRQWVYADLPQGRFAFWRRIVYGALIVVYFTVPWLSVNGQPVLRFDIPGRHYNIFGAAFVAADLYFLALFLLMSLVGLFLFSALLGRLWCGWMCPQTVYMEGVFRLVERWIEGTPLKRKKLDGGNHDAAYWTKKIFKHGTIAVVSVLLCLNFAAYFIDPKSAFAMLGNGGAGHPAAFITAAVLALATFGNFSWFREQFCTFLCPYARIQAVMIDDHSLIVGYDPVRGEPRGSLKPDQKQSERGDCIDCRRCVQVCPTGIDIRNGLQLECVSCTACMDACDEVMDRISRPRGLVRYDSLAGLARRPQRIIRVRVVLYSAVMLALISVFSVRLFSREVITLSVARTPGIPYLVQDDGKIRNSFNLHITNTDVRTVTVSVQVKGVEAMECTVPGQPFTVPPGERLAAAAFVLIPADRLANTSIPLAFRLLEEDRVISECEAVFLGPHKR